MADHEKFMLMAIRLAEENVNTGGGGPFGAVIVKDGFAIAQSANTVVTDKDPTAHAEVAVIRLACRKLNTHDLSGCVLYASCEPCPMCLGAIYWARLDRIYYGCRKEDATDIGFDDNFIYQEIDLAPSDRRLPSKNIMRKEALYAFQMWMYSKTKRTY